MPTSKPGPKRRAKLARKRANTNKWVARKVKAFNDLPNEERIALLAGIKDKITSKRRRDDRPPGQSAVEASTSWLLSESTESKEE